MRCIEIFLLFSCLTPLLFVVDCEVISLSVAAASSVVMAGFLGGYEYFKCKTFECCDQVWVPGNFQSLKQSLNNRLYGQHLVQDITTQTLKSHFNNPTPQKALVLSLHGGVGVGKNYVSQIITENWFQRATNSAYVNLFISTVHFPHASKIEEYKTKIQTTILSSIRKCSKSVFIFDEVDDLHPEVLGHIKPYIDFHKQIQGVDYRHAVYILLSNSGGNAIAQQTLEHWKAGKKREDITLKQMEDLINLAAFNEEGGLRFSRLISNHLIDHFIPFLPLEREHVKLCIRDYFRFKNILNPGEERINKVSDMLLYFPKDSQVFSTSGCKKVSQKVELLLAEEEEKQEEYEKSKSTRNREEF